MDKPTVVEAKVVNVSAGGLGIVAFNEFEPGTILTIDPKFDVSFPLAGLACRVIRVFKHAKGTGMSLEFVDLPTTRERDLVRTIYAYQHRRAMA